MAGEPKDRKVQTDMTPMIDVVFQLLIFFLFTFKIAPVEGEIGVNMPPLSIGSAVSQENPDVEKVPIRLAAGSGGRLEDIRLGDNSLGNDLRKLTETLKGTYSGMLTSLGTKVEVEIDADRALDYYWVIRATNAVMRANIDNINFTDPKVQPLQ